MATIPTLQIPTMGAVSGGADFSPLAQLPQLYQKYQQDQANKAALAQFQQTGDPKALIGSGDMNLAQLGIGAQTHMDALKQQAIQNKMAESHWADEQKYKYKALDQADKPAYHFTTNDWGETQVYKTTSDGAVELITPKQAKAEGATPENSTISPAPAATPAPTRSAPAPQQAFPAPLPSQIQGRPAFPAALPSQAPAPIAAPGPQTPPGPDLYAQLGIKPAPPSVLTPGNQPSLPPVAPAGPPTPPISQSNYAPLASLAQQQVPAWAQPPQALGAGLSSQLAQPAETEPPPVMAGAKFDNLQKEAEYQPKARNEQLLSQIAARSANMATDVKGIADGEIDPRQLPKKRQEFVISLVKQYDPSYDAGNMAGRFKAKSEFMSGGPNSPASTLVTGATAIGHIYDAFQNQKELGGTGNYGYLNKPLNKANVLGMELADTPALAAYNTNIGKVAEEGTKFYRGTGGTESDISRDIGSMSASHSPQSRVRTLAESATMMMAKINGLQDRWKNAIGEKSYNEEITRQGGNFILTQENLSKVNEIRHAANLPPVDMRGREISTAARAMQLQASGIKDKAELYDRLHREGFQ